MLILLGCLYLALLGIGGYGALQGLFPRHISLLRLGASTITGQLLALFWTMAWPTVGAMPLVGLVLMTGAVLAGVARLGIPSQRPRPGQMIRLSDVAVVVGLMVTVGLFAAMTSRWDGELHQCCVRQILRGAAFPRLGGLVAATPYHYGVDVLAAHVVRFSGLGVYGSLDLLVTFAAGGCALLVLGIARRYCTRWGSYAVMALALAGGGVAFLAKYLYYGSTWFLNAVSEMTLLSSLLQYPWCLGYPAVLTALAVAFDSPEKRTPIQWLSLTVLIMATLCAMTIANITVLPILLAMGILASGYDLAIHRESRRNTWLAVRVVSLAAVAALATAKMFSVGGASGGGEYFGPPRPVLTLTAILTGQVDTYGLSTFTFYPLTIIGALGAWLMMAWKWRHRTKAANQQRPLLDRGLWVLLGLSLLVLAPYVVYFPGLFYWDNFCKFPAVGILCSWMLWGLLWCRRGAGGGKFLRAMAVGVPLLATVSLGAWLSSEFSHNGGRWNADPDVPRLPGLHAAVETHCPPEAVFLMVCRDTYDPPSISSLLVPLPGKANRDLLNGLVACGTCVVNHNYLSHPLKRQTRAELAALCRRAILETPADAQRLFAELDWPVDFILCPYEDRGLVSELVAKGILTPLADSPHENWALYQLRSPE